jgi:hypothetical protein
MQKLKEIKSIKLKEMQGMLEEKDYVGFGNLHNKDSRMCVDE